jgi:hypothetical protein
MEARRRLARPGERLDPLADGVDGRMPIGVYRVASGGGGERGLEAPRRVEGRPVVRRVVRQRERADARGSLEAKGRLAKVGGASGMDEREPATELLLALGAEGPGSIQRSAR